MRWKSIIAGIIMSKESSPLRLKVVAYYFLLYGFINLIYSLITHFLSRDYSFIGSLYYLPIEVLITLAGFGLLHYKSAWRRFAIIWTLIWLILSVPLLIYPALTSPFFRFPHSLYVILDFALFLFVIWQYRVLMDPAIKRLFDATKPNDSANDSQM
jgi:hypothetical protein